MKAGNWRATRLDGLDVYNPNNEKIGDISELIIDRQGKIEAVVIGVGGFLGIGEHLVAVPYDQVQWIDQPRAVSSTAPGGTATTGSSSAPAPAVGADRADRPATTTAPMDRPAGTTATTDGPVGTTTSVERQSGTTVTTTTDRPAATATDRPAAGATGDRSAAAERGAPDHAIVAMTKEQLRALPEVRYSR
jgi:sporulation protein YlmC with PRC-barrel domain